MRHWDTWLTERKFALFGGSLNANGSQYSFSGNLTNYVSAISNVTRAECPIQPMGGTDNYDISPDGSMVAFMTKNVDLTLANYTSSIIYFAPHDGSSQAVPINAWNSGSTPPNAHGASASPAFSPDGTQFAYLQMDGESYESDKNKIYISSVGMSDFNITVLAEDWDVTPSTVAWSQNASSLFIHAPYYGNEPIFEVPLTAQANFEPTNITYQGVVAGMSVLPDGNILVSDSKIWSSRDVYIISPTGEIVTDLFHANEVDPELAGLGPNDVSEFYFEGNFTQVQSWLVYPAGFDPNQTYPLAFIVHGGPQGGSYNSWSTRWNFKVWADQGYVVVAPNPTGSTGWGMAFQDAIQNNWGSYPYDDLVKCWNYVNSTFDYIDTANGIEAGASYGGYMTNWIQGHDLGRQFKALVTHDGSTSTLNQYASEELWFMQHDFNGTLWDNRENYEQWNPIDYINEWATPHFVVHNTMDYRLPESEGIMLFNILQEKGVPSKFLNFPDENHWVLNRENSLVWHTEIYKWINYYSGISNATSPY